MNSGPTENQMSLFHLDNDNKENNTIHEAGRGIKVVNAKFIDSASLRWNDLFDGFDELYAITFSSGMDFINRVVSKFRHAEVVFGCESTLDLEMDAIIASQVKILQEYVKHKSAKAIAERIQGGMLKLYVSRDTKSHEKIFILKSDAGKTRVITGSANMSASAFCGLQRENIVCFDDYDAYDYYMDLFASFKVNCSDKVQHSTLFASLQDPEYLEDNIDEVPIIQTVEKKPIILEEVHAENEEPELIASIKDYAGELKPIIPKQKKTQGKLIVSKEYIRSIKPKISEERERSKIVKDQRLPKLHLNYDNYSLDFNGKEIDLTPDRDKVQSDVECILNYFKGFDAFHGDTAQAKKSYYSFMNWYFASAFMPYLRLTAYKNNYEMIPFPVFGIIYGDSNGGKSTFTKLLAKLMSGKKVPLNNSTDFTSSDINSLKEYREGLPIIIDDLAKMQFQNNNEKIIKDDEWGIEKRLINYPAVVITTNKLPSITPDISKRAVTCHIDVKINKEDGARNSKKINDSMGAASTAFYGEYVRRMFAKVKAMEESMRTDSEFFPDIFEESSKTIYDIFSESINDLPEFVSVLTFKDYFGDKAVSRNAIDKLMRAWENEPKQFKVDKKSNKLIYSCPENGGRYYELKYLQDELPPSLNAQLNATNLVMQLDAAEKLFERKFKKKFWGF